MNIQFHDLTPELEDKIYYRLVKVAKINGLEVDEYVKQLLIEGIHTSLMQMRRD